jgi:hypothetical protein
MTLSGILGMASDFVVVVSDALAERLPSSKAKVFKGAFVAGNHAAASSQSSIDDAQRDYDHDNGKDMVA